MITAPQQQSPYAAARTGPGGMPGGVSCTLPVTPAAAPAPALRRFAGRTARQWGLPEAAHESLTVIVSELVTNVILHSGSPDVTLGLRLTGRVLTVEVRDAGLWQVRTAPRREPLDDVSCGRGLVLVEAYAARTAVRLSPGGTTVLADITLDGAAPEGAAVDATAPAVDAPDEGGPSEGGPGA
ncbi:ATP-binding protein [Streptomyces sp. TRM 70351]|uniref:ATP-binding protein n=1 Tax=Streptomyces sp. TRM 70351 TaxID=3116552 RepID=UPI002E7B817E|nr:ATP-binding protein [Streptomyces sp. TRM 70351]MEE1930210.1 ATP-binding protein [Streptomyces sp. TRM 70351]